MADGPQRLGHIRWEGFSHRHMWHMIMDAQPDDVFRRYEDWKKLSDGFVEVNEGVQQTLNTLFATWRGMAAVQASSANTRLLGWAQEATETAAEIGEQLGTYGNALVQARKTMPQPRATSLEQDYRAGRGAVVDDDPVYAYELVQLTTDHMASSQERAAARQTALDVMREFEARATEVRQDVAPRRFTAPPQTGIVDVVQPPLPPVPPDDPPPPVPPPYPPIAPPPYPPAPHPGPHGDDDGPATVNPSWAGPGSGHGGSAGPGGGHGYGAGWLPGAGQGSQGQGGPVGPGGYGAAGAAGVPGRGPAFGGVPGAGALGAGAETAATRGAAASGAGAAGRGAGMGGMYPPMGGGSAPGEDDTEKRLAPYLVDDDLFEDDRTVAPPVFGA